MPEMPVTEFLAVSLQAVLDNDGPFPQQPSSWFSSDSPNCGEDAVLSLESVPPLEFVRQLESAFSQQWLNGACCIIDHTDNTRRFPLWAPTFFRQIIELRVAQERWTESHLWLPPAERYLLEHVSWNTKHVGAPDGQLDWTRLISDEWLSGGIIDEMTADIKSCVLLDPSLASTTLIAPLAFQFYVKKFATENLAKTKYLDKIAAEVRSGKSRMIFPIHYNLDHWMAFVIDFTNKTLGFGESETGLRNRY
jgi:hypothetical protein